MKRVASGYMTPAEAIAAAKTTLEMVDTLTREEAERQGDLWSGQICSCRIGADHAEDGGRNYFQDVAMAVEERLRDLLAALEPANSPPFDIEDVLIGGREEG